jgi:hypothetical protein
VRQLIVAGKLFLILWCLSKPFPHDQSAAEAGRSSAADFFFASVLQ